MIFVLFVYSKDIQFGVMKKNVEQCSIWVLMILLWSCSSKEEFLQPSRTTIISSVYASGEVKSKDQYQVYSKVNGMVDRVWVKKGQIVKKGDVLVQLENTSAQKNYESARLQYDNAAQEAQVNKWRELKESVEIAYKKYQTDSMVYFRQKQLWSKEIGTKLEYEQKELLFQQSKSNWIAAKARLADFNRQTAFNRSVQQKNVELTKSLQEDFFIRSAVDGKVYDLVKERGEWVTPAAPIAIIGNAGTYVIELAVDEKDIVKIKVGQTVTVRMDSYKDSVFSATVSSIDPIMNTKTRTFTIVASFVQQPAVLYPYLTVEANILIAQKEKALVIPIAYLTDQNEVKLSDGSWVKVETGLRNYQYVEIVKGITAESKLSRPVGK